MFNTLINAVPVGRISSYIILVLYILVMIGIAYYCRTKKESGLNDFFLAGRGLGGWMSAFAYGTTYFSAVIFIGYAGKLGWAFGMAAVWIGIGNAIIGTWLAWKVLALKTRNMSHRLNVKTMPEFFESRYDSKYIKLFSSIIVFIFLIPYSTSVYQGLGYLFELIFGIDFVYVVLIMAGLTALYLFFGGYLATAITDFVQGLIMIGGVIIMVVLVLNKVDWFKGIQGVVDLGGKFIPTTNSPTGSFIDSPFISVAALFILTSLGIWGLPQSVHKFYAVKDKPAITRATVISTVFSAIIGIGAYFVGTFGKLVLNGEMPAGGFDYIIPNMLIKTMPAIVLGLIGVLVLSASMSSLSSLALSSSSAVSVDLYKGYINKNASDKSVKLLMRILCLVFVALSAVFAMTNFAIIITLMSLSWGTLAGCFLGPYIWGLYSKKTTRASVWATMIIILAYTFGMIAVFGIKAPDPDSDGVMAVIKGGLSKTPIIGSTSMILSLILTPVISKFTKQPDKEVLDKAFNGQ
ncbi:MAG: sodium:solute symporter family protein [Christensenellales bacterium]|jgi:SSS family solute:Na+ symporter